MSGDILSLASPWMEPGKLGPTQGRAAVATCRPLRVGAWQFYWYQSIWFLNNFKFFWSPVDIGNPNLLKISGLNWIFVYWTFTPFCRMDSPPPRRGRDRPRRGQVDEEVASTPYNFLLAPELRVWSKLKGISMLFLTFSTWH